MTQHSDSANSGHGIKLTRSFGRLFVISAPSGAGKSTLCKAACRHLPDLQYSISRTTRLPRSGEKDGVDYIFISKDEFVRGINTDRWAEWAEVHGNYYGTCAADIEKGLRAGRNILLDIDVQGAQQIVKRYPHAVTIFIMPPTILELQRRLEARATEDAETISKRMRNAIAEIDQSKHYHHIIVNDHLEASISDLVAIIEQADLGHSGSDL